MMQVHRLVLGALDTNCYVVSDEGGAALVVDPADDANAIVDYLQSRNLVVHAVVLTHAHFDHMLAAETISHVLAVPLYVGRGDAAAMTDPLRNLSGLFGMSHPVAVTDFSLLQEGESLSVGRMTFTVMETPGHTPGCICLLGNGLLFAGDTLFRGSIGRLDFPGGDELAMLGSLQRLKKLPAETTVYPGHGPDTTIGCERDHNPYLR